jgi:hypothetical protein
MHQALVLERLFAFNLGNTVRRAIKHSTSADETYLNKHATVLLSEVLMQMKQQCIVCYHKRKFVQHIFPLCILNDKFYNNTFHNVLFVTDPRCKLQHQMFVFIIYVPVSFLNA